MAHTITNGVNQDEGVECNAGWIHAADLVLTSCGEGNEERFAIALFLICGRLAPPGFCEHVLDIDPADAPRYINSSIYGEN